MYGSSARLGALFSNLHHGSRGTRKSMGVRFLGSTLNLKNSTGVRFSAFSGSRGTLFRGYARVQPYRAYRYAKGVYSYSVDSG